MKTPEQLIGKALTIQEGEFKGARVIPTPERIKQLMLDYHAQFEKKPKKRNK